MKRGFFVHAAGWVGAALVLQRFSVAAFLIAIPLRRLDCSTWPAIALDALAVMVAAGLQTRITAGIASAVAIFLTIKGGELLSMPLSAHLLDSLALTIAGPGAFSVDSRLFGRRTVHLSG